MIGAEPHSQTGIIVKEEQLGSISEYHDKVVTTLTTIIMHADTVNASLIIKSGLDEPIPNNQFNCDACDSVHPAIKDEMDFINAYKVE